MTRQNYSLGLTIWNVSLTEIEVVFDTSPRSDSLEFVFFCFFATWIDTFRQPSATHLSNLYVHFDIPLIERSPLTLFSVDPPREESRLFLEFVTEIFGRKISLDLNQPSWTKYDLVTIFVIPLVGY